MTAPPVVPTARSYGTNPYGQAPVGSQPQAALPPPLARIRTRRRAPLPHWPLPQQPYPRRPAVSPVVHRGVCARTAAEWTQLEAALVDRCGLAVLGVVALVATLVVMFSGDDKKSPSARPRPPRRQAPRRRRRRAPRRTPRLRSECGPGETPKGDAIFAGKLSFPASAAPGWSPFSDDQDPT